MRRTVAAIHVVSIRPEDIGIGCAKERPKGDAKNPLRLWQGLGDTVLIDGTGGIGAFAVCHYGPRSEVGADACFINSVRVGPAEQAYLPSARSCEALHGRSWHAERAPVQIWRAKKPIDTSSLAGFALGVTCTGPQRSRLLLTGFIDDWR